MKILLIILIIAAMMVARTSTFAQEVNGLPLKEALKYSPIVLVECMFQRPVPRPYNNIMPITGSMQVKIHYGQSNQNNTLKKSRQRVWQMYSMMDLLVLMAEHGYKPLLDARMLPKGMYIPNSDTATEYITSDTKLRGEHSIVRDNLRETRDTVQQTDQTQRSSMVMFRIPVTPNQISTGVVTSYPIWFQRVETGVKRNPDARTPH